MPCDTRSQQPTYTFAQAVTHTHTHTHTHPLLCPRALLFPQSGSQVTFTAIWRRNLFWMTKRVHATRRSCEGMAAREAAHASRPSSWCGDRSRRTRLVHGFSVPPSDFPHAHGSSLSAPTSLVPQCRCAQDVERAGMVFRHYDTMMATRL